jgi:hypothetical protein
MCNIYLTLVGILITHTSKVPPHHRLSKNHLKGAKTLSNLVDEVIGLKASCQSEDQFYLKQFKGRINDKPFNEDNVLVFQRKLDELGRLVVEVIGTTSVKSSVN